MLATKRVSFWLRGDVPESSLTVLLEQTLKKTAAWDAGKRFLENFIGFFGADAFLGRRGGGGWFMAEGAVSLGGGRGRFWRH